MNTCYSIVTCKCNSVEGLAYICCIKTNMSIRRYHRYLWKVPQISMEGTQLNRQTEHACVKR